MPLPSMAYDLDWNSLVQAAQEYESKYQRINEYSNIQCPQTFLSFDTYKCINAIALDIKYQIMWHVQTNNASAFLTFFDSTQCH